MTLASRWPWRDLGQLGGQSNRRQSSLTQHLPSTWQIAALYAFLAMKGNENRAPDVGSPGLAPGGGVDDLSAAAPARPWETSITHGCWGDSQSHLLAKRGHLSWVVEREDGSQVGERGWKRCRPARAFLMATSEFASWWGKLCFASIVSFSRINFPRFAFPNKLSTK